MGAAGGKKRHGFLSTSYEEAAVERREKFCDHDCSTLYPTSQKGDGKYLNVEKTESIKTKLHYVL